MLIEATTGPLTPISGRHNLRRANPAGVRVAPGRSIPVRSCHASIQFGGTRYQADAYFDASSCRLCECAELVWPPRQGSRFSEHEEAWPELQPQVRHLHRDPSGWVMNTREKVGFLFFSLSVVSHRVVLHRRGTAIISHPIPPLHRVRRQVSVGRQCQWRDRLTAACSAVSVRERGTHASSVRRD